MAKVLIIDDDKSICEALEFFLSEAGYKTYSIGCTSDPVSLALQYQPDIIILDFFISGMCGEDIALALRGNNETLNLPIIMISANSEARQVAKNTGINKFIPKPFEISALLESIESLLSPTINHTPSLYV